MTSAAEMIVPRILNLLKVSHNDRLRLTKLRRRQPRVGGQGNLRRQPELCLTIRVGDVHMNTHLFT